MIGEQISHYRIESKIGAGTYGVVYKAVHIRDPELKVAIKVVHSSLLEDPRFVESLKSECRRLDKLDHAAIVRFRDLILEDKLVAMVLELLEGMDLHDHIQAGTVPINSVVSIIEKALVGLAYAHEQGVIHRDIKPSNIFLCHDGRVKLLDFGIARAAQNTQATQTGTMKGTLDYMAPERFRATGGGSVSDVYAMGLVLWELAAGEPACPSGGLPEKLGWHLGVGPVPLRSVRPDAPEWLSSLVSQMTTMDPDERLADGQAVLAAFKAGRTSGSVEPAAPPPRRAAPSTVALSKDEVADVVKQVDAPKAAPARAAPPGTVAVPKAAVAAAVKQAAAMPPAEPEPPAGPPPETPSTPHPSSAPEPVHRSFRLTPPGAAESTEGISSSPVPEKGAGLGPYLIGAVAVGLGGIVIVGILAAIAIPNFIDMQYRAKRAEVPANVAGIKTAQIAYDAAFDIYVEVSSYKPSGPVGRAQRSWKAGTSFDTLGWGPDGKVRGAYKVTSSSSTDFLVTGICDVDGDGTRASYTATKSINTTRNTLSNIY